MCGIIGYIGFRNVKNILIQGLKRLDYRGYDSCGLAFLENGKIKSKKVVGRIEILKKELEKTVFNSHVGIAHTRWATHGAVTEKNAHPHFSCDKKIALVHNGIIENYFELKQLLLKEGHHFESETDTEVLTHLIEKFLNKEQDIEDSFINSLKVIEGAYAIAMIYSKEPDKIFIARKSSPVVIGINGLDTAKEQKNNERHNNKIHSNKKHRREFFIASDISALIPYTKKFVFLKDNELAIASREKLIIKNLKKVKIDHEIIELKIKAEAISRRGFPNFMKKEIFEQQKTIAQAFKGRINKILNFNLKMKISEDEIKELKRIVLLGCGTSWHAALVGKYLFEDLAQIPCQAEYASEFRYSNPILDKETLVIVLSQSGETADTLAALKEIKEKKIKTIGLVNSTGSSISREVDSGFYLHSGIEVGVASTKTFTSHLTILYLLALYFAFVKKKISKKKVNKMLNELKKIPGKVKRILNQDNEIRKIAIKYFKHNNALYLGRGYNYPIALEGALKLKEISYIHAEGYPAAEMKHGPIALIDKDMPSIFIAPIDRLYKKILNNIEEIKSRNGKVIAITTEDNKKILKKVDEAIFIPKTTEQLMPILTVIPTQLLAYHIAMMRGCDVDKPRNLAKSVTVE